MVLFLSVDVVLYCKSVELYLCKKIIATVRLGSNSTFESCTGS